jgi:hypothetical protein
LSHQNNLMQTEEFFLEENQSDLSILILINLPEFWLCSHQVRPLFRSIGKFALFFIGISHPFTIEDYPFIEDGVCLTGVACLRVATKDKNELSNIFSSFKAGILTDRLYNFTCCKGLTIDLLQALGKDIGFEFDIYLVADDKGPPKSKNSSEIFFFAKVSFQQI